MNILTRLFGVLCILLAVPIGLLGLGSGLSFNPGAKREAIILFGSAYALAFIGLRAVRERRDQNGRRYTPPSVPSRFTTRFSNPRLNGEPEEES